MADEHDRVTAALRDLGDADALRAPAQASRALLREFQARFPERFSTRAGRGLGLAIAATLVAGLATSLWLVTRELGQHSTTSNQQPGTSGSAAEIATEFMPLPYGAVPYTDARLVRLAVPRTALAAFGLAPPDAAEIATEDTVTADVLVGEDGLARAVRFVRAPRAPGVAP